MQNSVVSEFHPFRVERYIRWRIFSSFCPRKSVQEPPFWLSPNFHSMDVNGSNMRWYEKPFKGFSVRISKENDTRTHITDVPLQYSHRTYVSSPWCTVPQKYGTPTTNVRFWLIFSLLENLGGLGVPRLLRQLVLRCDLGLAVLLVGDPYEADRQGVRRSVWPVPRATKGPEQTKKKEKWTLNNTLTSTGWFRQHIQLRERIWSNICFSTPLCDEFGLRSSPQVRKVHRLSMVQQSVLSSGETGELPVNRGAVNQATQSGENAVW